MKEENTKNEKKTQKNTKKVKEHNFSEKVKKKLKHIRDFDFVPNH